MEELFCFENTIRKASFRNISFIRLFFPHGNPEFVVIAIPEDDVPSNDTEGDFFTCINEYIRQNNQIEDTQPHNSEFSMDQLYQHIENNVFTYYSIYLHHVATNTVIDDSRGIPCLYQDDDEHDFILVYGQNSFTKLFLPESSADVIYHHRDAMFVFLRLYDCREKLQPMGTRVSFEETKVHLYSNEMQSTRKKCLLCHPCFSNQSLLLSYDKETKDVSILSRYKMYQRKTIEELLGPFLNPYTIEFLLRKDPLYVSHPRLSFFSSLRYVRIRVMVTMYSLEVFFFMFV